MTPSMDSVNGLSQWTQSMDSVNGVVEMGAVFQLKLRFIHIIEQNRETDERRNGRVKEAFR